MNILNSFNDNPGKKFAVLVDPDKGSKERFKEIAEAACESSVDYILVGGSLLTTDSLDICIQTIKDNCNIPVVLFPGNTLQISEKADAILFLSLISGRNPEMLIGNHVIAAPYLRQAGIEVIPTGYMLIDSGRMTTAMYMSNTKPIPADKDDVAACTAMAGEMLGLKMIYMDAGSGAQNPISGSMISMVKKNVDLPIVLGGGIDTPEKATMACQAGADMIVVGNAIEKNISLITSISEAVHAI
jgi:putative glycerol-1-phosphate prenyltransferase